MVLRYVLGGLLYIRVQLSRHAINCIDEFILYLWILMQKSESLSSSLPDPILSLWSYWLRFYYLYHKITIIHVEILIRVRISTVIFCLRTRFLVGRYFVYVYILWVIHWFTITFICIHHPLIISCKILLNLFVRYTLYNDVSGIHVSEAVWLSSSYFLNCIQGLNSSLFLFGLLE